MFNIAICDDEETLIGELKENLIKYAAETNKEFCFFIYHDGSVYFKEGIWFASPFFAFARHGRALTGASPEHAQIVGSV